MSTSPSLPASRRLRRSGSSSTSCARPRRSARRSRPATERVLCCAEIDDARALAETEGPAKLAGERRLEAIEGFDFGNSPRELEGEPAAETLILTTTNGTRLLVAAAERFERVYVGSLLNLDAVAAAARESGEDVAVLCAGVLGELALDDAYCAGRIAEALGGEPADSARAAILLARSFPSALEGLGASRSAVEPAPARPRGRRRAVRAGERPRRRPALRPPRRPRGRSDALAHRADCDSCFVTDVRLPGVSAVSIALRNSSPVAVVVLVVEEDDRRARFALGVVEDHHLRRRQALGPLAVLDLALQRGNPRPSRCPRTSRRVQVPSKPSLWVSARAYAPAASSAKATTVRQFRSVAGTPSSDSIRAFERREPWTPRGSRR